MKKISSCFADIFAAGLICIMMVFAIPAEAAELPVKTYTVTFRAGNVGSFAAESDIAGGNNVEITANYIRFTVEKGESLGSTFGYLSDAAALEAFFLNLTEVDDGYCLKKASDWCGGAAEAAADRNVEYVLDYVRLVNPVKYSISFVDAESGEQIAPPTIAYGNEGEEILCKPLSLENYDTTDKETVLVLNPQKETENAVVFKYTYSGEEEVIVKKETHYKPGKTIVKTIVNEEEREIVESAPVRKAADKRAASEEAEKEERQTTEEAGKQEDKITEEAEKQEEETSEEAEKEERQTTEEAGKQEEETTEEAGKQEDKTTEEAENKEEEMSGEEKSKGGTGRAIARGTIGTATLLAAVGAVIRKKKIKIKR